MLSWIAYQDPLLTVGAGLAKTITQSAAKLRVAVSSYGGKISS